MLETRAPSLLPPARRWSSGERNRCGCPPPPAALGHRPDAPPALSPEPTSLADSAAVEGVRGTTAKAVSGRSWRSCTALVPSTVEEVPSRDGPVGAGGGWR